MDKIAIKSTNVIFGYSLRKCGWEGTKLLINYSMLSSGKYISLLTVRLLLHQSNWSVDELSQFCCHERSNGTPYHEDRSQGNLGWQMYHCEFHYCWTQMHTGIPDVGDLKLPQSLPTQTIIFRFISIGYCSISIADEDSNTNSAQELQLTAS